MTTLSLHTRKRPATPKGEQPLEWLKDPWTILAMTLYGLSFLGLAIHAKPVLPALLLGFGVMLLGEIASFVSRRWTPPSYFATGSRLELAFALAWYGLVFLLAAITLSRGFELINGFTNWFFLVILPVGFLVRARRGGITPRDVLRSIGVTRQGLRNALLMVALIVPLSIPMLYLVGEQQRKAILMIVEDPFQAVAPFSLSFLLALCTAGFVEDFFFRGILQSRLAHFLGSELRGLLFASLLFGLFHLPTYFFSPYEPTQGNIVWATSSVITEQAVAGVLFGILWRKTHNLAAPALLHAFFNAMAMMATIKIGTG